MNTWLSRTSRLETCPLSSLPWGIQLSYFASWLQRRQSKHRWGPTEAAWSRRPCSPASQSIPPAPSCWVVSVRTEWSRVRTLWHLDFISVYNRHLPSGTASWDDAIFILGRISDRPIGGMRLTDWAVTGVIATRVCRGCVCRLEL